MPPLRVQVTWAALECESGAWVVRPCCSWGKTAAEGESEYLPVFQ